MSMDYIPVTRSELADFIERAVAGTDPLEDWSRVIINHYHDEVMEEARIAVVRLVAIKAKGDPKGLTPDDADRLRAAAATLR
jgi:hypothetical protein